MEEDWKEVYLTNQEHQAIIAKDILENEGIVVVVLNQHDSTYNTFGEYRILVPAEFEKNALELLKELKS